MEKSLIALEKLIQGSGDLAALQAAIAETVGQRPGTARDIEQAVEVATRAGRLDPALRAQIVEFINAQARRALESGAQQVADRTRIRAVRPQPAPDATRIDPRIAARRTQAPAPPAPAPAAEPPETQWLEPPPDASATPSTHWLEPPPEPPAAQTQWLAPPKQTVAPGPVTQATQPLSAEERAALALQGSDDGELREGAVLLNRYRLEQRLGDGGMGVVFRARDLLEQEFSDQPYLAIKVLKPDFREHPDSLKALHEEVQKSRSLTHPNIVNVYTFDRDGDVFFMTMELLEGRTLKERIDTDCRLGMPFDDAWPIIEGAGRALAYAHQHSVVHSDLKPSNIFVTREGQAKVLDFGIARAIGGSGSSRFDAQSLGALTPGYASCEMLEGKPPDPRDDVYAFACVVYEVLTGRHPFAAAPAVLARDSKLKVRPIEGLSRKRNAAIERALAFDRDQRTPSIERFLKDLQPPAPMTKMRMLAYAAAAVAVVAVGGAFYWLAGGIETTEEADRAFVQRLMQARDERSQDYDAELVDLLLEQGMDYLTQARERFDPAILSEGVTTAHYAFTKALEMDPHNQRAAEGVLEVLRMYRLRAQQAAAAGRHREALELTDIGLRINPESRELRRLRATLLEKLAAETAQ